MKLLRSAIPAVALALTMALPAFAQQPNWLARCNRQLNAGNNDPDTGNYVYSTRGKEAGAAARAVFDYTAKAPAHTTVYPTAAKDMMNPYGGASVSVNHYMTGGFKSAATIGQISMRATAKDFKPIPGEPVQMKLVLDGKAFGPYQPPASANSDGMYSAWFDTADTDGDSKPPVLKPAEFATLAKAVDAAKTVEVVLVQNGADIVRMPVVLTKRTEWLAGLGSWATSVASSTTGGVICIDRIVN